MKLALVYNPNDTKLLPSAYSWTYRDMFLAVCERFAPVLHVTENCKADSINADVILFWDVHSSHHIEIEGLKDHPAIKVEYFNDPHQKEQFGQYKTGQKFHKLSAQRRTERALSRGVKYIICPYKNGYEKYIKPFANDIEFIWFPVAPKNRISNPTSLAIRKKDILASGHLWQGDDEFKPYEFRNWAYSQPCIFKAAHSIVGDTPSGNLFQPYLAQFAGAFALCDCYVVPKYIEIPLAGCVPFCQMLDEYRELGFEDGKNCIAVTKENFNNRVSDFLANTEKYQSIADNARITALNYTADKFAEYLYEYLKVKLNK